MEENSDTDCFFQDLDEVRTIRNIENINWIIPGARVESIFNQYYHSKFYAKTCGENVMNCSNGPIKLHSANEMFARGRKD